jgi:hypothetical protein
MFESRIEQLNDATEVEHFENIQSTNWQTVRWKPPPPRTKENDPHIGWRYVLQIFVQKLSAKSSVRTGLYCIV